MHGAALPGETSLPERSAAGRAVAASEFDPVAASSVCGQAADQLLNCRRPPDAVKSMTQASRTSHPRRFGKDPGRGVLASFDGRARHIRPPGRGRPLVTALAGSTSRVR
jgi:hypothetical protein